MPTVRLTKKLIEAINKNAISFVTKQREALPEIDTKDANRIVNNFIEFFNLQPHKEDFLNSKIEFLSLDNYPLDTDIKTSVMIMITPVFIPIPTNIFSGSKTIRLNFDNINYEFPQEDIQVIKINMNQRYNISKQCDDFEEQIKKLLTRCTTIKQFIEAWPQGEQFIPSSDLQKHYEQEKKIRKRGVYLEDEELADLNSLLLTSKIT